MTRVITQVIREGRYCAEVDIRSEDDGSAFSPVIVKDDEFKTDRVRAALKKGDVAAAKREAKVFELTEVE
jgi:predicted RecB family endonuclease